MGATERRKLQLDQHCWQVMGGIHSDLAANSFGGFQLVLPTGVRAAHWFLEGTHQRTPKDKGFPGGAVVKNPPANAGDTGFEAWSGKIPHAAEQLSPRATTTEAFLGTVYLNFILNDTC